MVVYSCQFPAMVGVSLQSADAVLLVYAVDDEASWDEVARLRDTVIRYKGDQVGCIVYKVVILVIMR